jgi:hypothetical protein
LALLVAQGRRGGAKCVTAQHRQPAVRGQYGTHHSLAAQLHHFRLEVHAYRGHQLRASSSMQECAVLGAAGNPQRVQVSGGRSCGRTSVHRRTGVRTHRLRTHSTTAMLALRTSSKPPVANRSSRLDLPTPLSPTSRICAAGGEEWTQGWSQCTHDAQQAVFQMARQRGAGGAGRRQADGGVTPPVRRRQHRQAGRQHVRSINAP